VFGINDKKTAPLELMSGLVLFHYASCPFCRRVCQHIQQQGWGIEERDILKNSRWREELMAGGGRTQVPCLKIENTDGTVDWMYESMDIVNYLNDRLS